MNLPKWSFIYKPRSILIGHIALGLDNKLNTVKEKVGMVYRASEVGCLKIIIIIILLFLKKKKRYTIKIRVSSSSTLC